MLGVRMKKYLLLAALCLFLCCCTDHNDTSYEPLYLNETNENVLLLWSHPEETESVGEVKIAPKDTGYCLPGEVFPILLKSGLHGIEDYPLFNVRLVFGDEEKKCLNFEGDEFLERDIRRFSSYENIGPCDFCVERAMATPDGMLYRITDDLLERAEPCE